MCYSVCFRVVCLKPARTEIADFPVQRTSFVRCCRMLLVIRRVVRCEMWQEHRRTYKDMQESKKNKALMHIMQTCSDVAFEQFRTYFAYIGRPWSCGLNSTHFNSSNPFRRVPWCGWHSLCSWHRLVPRVCLGLPRAGSCRACLLSSQTNMPCNRLMVCGMHGWFCLWYFYWSSVAQYDTAWYNMIQKSVMGSLASSTIFPLHLDM